MPMVLPVVSCEHKEVSKEADPKVKDCTSIAARKSLEVLLEHTSGSCTKSIRLTVALELVEVRLL